MPRIQMTPTVRFALFLLRVYLIVLLALITLKFVRTFSASRPQPESPPRVERVERAENAGHRLGLPRLAIAPQLPQTSGVFKTSEVSG